MLSNLMKLYLTAVCLFLFVHLFGTGVLLIFRSDLLVLMCVSPRLVKVTSRSFGFSRYVCVPCGSCVECLKRRQNDWKVRICKEAEYWSHVYFFTLTYRNESLPCHVYYRDTISEPLYSGSFVDCRNFVSGIDDDLYIASTALKSDIQKWYKAMREDISRKHYDYDNGERWQCKYFICSEYGPNPQGTKRPHYHGIIMCNEPKHILQPYFENWRADYGRMEFKECGFERSDHSSVANYVSKYCAKGCYESRLEDIQNGLISKAFYLMSKNIGERWIEANKTNWLRYIPTAYEIKGDWSIYDVENFFDSGTDYSLKVLKEVNNLLDNLFVFDGDNEQYKYKLPRYFRERLFLKRKCFINTQILKKNGKKCYSLKCCPVGQCASKSFCLSYRAEPLTIFTTERKDNRYVSESFISVALAYCLSMRVSNSDRRNFETFCEQNPDRSYAWLVRDYIVRKENARESRRKDVATSLREFYQSNMYNHREFDFGNDFGEIVYTNFIN